MSYQPPSVPSSGITFAQAQSAGGASAVVEKIIAKLLAGTAAPTVAPTLAANTDAGSTLPTATYYVVVTETNGIGETTASPVSAGQAITSGTNHLTITPAALQTGNTAWNAYVSESASGPFTLALTGQTGSSANITAPLPTNSYAVAPPTANTTGLSYTAGAVAATATPGTPTLSATGGGTTGGALAAGTYYVKVTETNVYGESGPSAEASVTIAAGNSPEITFAALQAGAAGRNVYVGTAAGAETLYASGVLSSTYNLAVAIPSGGAAPPLVPSNGRAGTVVSTKLNALRGVETGRLQSVWLEFAQIATQFFRGEPITYPDAESIVRRAHTVFLALAQACDDVGTLIDANPGTLATTTTAITVPRLRRQWP